METFVVIFLSLGSSFTTFMISLIILRIFLKHNGIKFSKTIDKIPLFVGSSIVFVCSIILFFIAKSLATHSYSPMDLSAMYYGYRTYLNENEFFPLLFTFIPLNIIVGIAYTYIMAKNKNLSSLSNNS